MNSDFENSDDVVGILLLRGLIVFFTAIAELAKEIVTAGRDHHQLVTTRRREHGVVRTQRGGIAEEIGPVRNTVGQLVVIDFVQVDLRMPEQIVFAKTVPPQIEVLQSQIDTQHTRPVLVLQFLAECLGKVLGPNQVQAQLRVAVKQELGRP